MKRIFFTLFLLVSTSATLFAQLQLSNPGFESWEATSLQAKPSGWSSFPQSDGSWAWAASTPQHYHRNGGRPGATGNSFVTIFSRSVLGVVANGNMTTGQVHAGSTTATSSNNYNYSHRGSYAHTFSGTPDSMYVWVSYYAASASSQASVRAYIHGDSDFKDPNDCSSPSLFRGAAVAQFTRTTSSNASYNWQQVKVPFIYSGSSSVNYILMSMTTNATAGAGSAGDSLSVDDIEFIYSAWLDSLLVNGLPIADFRRDSLHYSLSISSTFDLHQAAVTVVTQASDATVSIDTAWISPYLLQFSINVMAEDSVTTRTYQLTLDCPEPVCNPVSDLQASVENNSAIVTWTPGEGNTQWEAEYALSGFSLGNGTVVTCPTAALILNDLEYSQSYDLFLRAICTDSLYTDWYGPISFTTSNPPVVDCQAPDSISVITEISDTVEATPYFTVQWFCSLDSASYQLMLMNGSDTIIDTTTTNPLLSFSNLQPGTTYVVKVRTLCDTINFSAWIATTFSTPDEEEPVLIDSPAMVQLNLFPNPSNGRIQIICNIQYDQVSIFNTLGQEVLRSTNVDTLDLSHLPNGFYLLSIMQNHHPLSTRSLILSR